MSDDLVKRLRDTPNWMREGFQDWKDNVRTYDSAPFEAADHIEELEAKLSKSEALLAKAVEAAEKAVGHIERIPPRMATARVELCDALAKLKGQDDE